MSDPFARRDGSPPVVTAPQKLEGRVKDLFKATGNHFQTSRCDALEMTFEGIAGDLHSGYTRKSGSREPWYTRGTEMRNERQITIVAPDELARIAAIMDLKEVRPEWIGANILMDGVPELSMLPPSTLVFFSGGVTLKIDGQNAPCRAAGLSVARNAGMPDEESGSLAFPRAAQRLRGLCAWVERPGTVRVGETVSVRVGEQWIYRS
jgi:MOSC domain